MRIKLLHLIRRRRRPCLARLRRGLILNQLPAQLVTDHLNGRSHVERGVSGVRRDMDQSMAAVQLLIGQAGAFTAKQQGHRMARGFQRKRVHGRSRIFRRTGQMARSGRKPSHEAHTGESLSQRFMHPCLLKYVVGASSTRRGVGMGKLPGPHQMQVYQPHGLHRPRRGANVTRQLGFDHYNMNSVELHDNHRGTAPERPIVYGKVKRFTRRRASCYSCAPSPAAPFDRP